MERFKESLTRFMSGRYGVDKLYNALVVFSLALMIANIFIKSPIVSLFMCAVIVIAICRSMSRNIGRRSLENDKYLAVRKLFSKRLSLTLRRIREIGTKRFRTCPHCKAVIEMPRRKGKRLIVCPRCHTQFETRISI